MAQDFADSVTGCLLGTAVGDAIGLSYEGLTRQRQQRLFPHPERYHLLPGRGMVSDDTEHTCMVAQALIASAGEPQAFAHSLAWRLRFWLLGVPAGIGYATLRAICKLWLGFPSDRSGVFSAGNGPAMRSALIGVCYGQDPARLNALVRASSRITHTDPRAEHGALAVALAAHLAAESQAVDPRAFLALLQERLGGEAGELLDLIARAVASAERQETTESFAASLGLEKGVSGYVLRTVPVTLHAWLTHPADLRGGILAVVRCGGDTDTTGAITGGILGAAVGRAGISQEWLDGLWEWPRTVAWMDRLGTQLAAVVQQDVPQRPPPLFVPGLFLRNLVFIGVVLSHGLRRLLPPYG